MSVTRLYRSSGMLWRFLLELFLLFEACVSCLYVRHVSVPKKAILVWCRGCALRIVRRLSFVCAGPRLTKFKWKLCRFSQSRYSVLPVIDVRLHCGSREYLQLFETFLSIYYIFNEMKWKSSFCAERILLSKKKKGNKRCITIFVWNKEA